MVVGYLFCETGNLHSTVGFECHGAVGLWLALIDLEGKMGTGMANGNGNG